MKTSKILLFSIILISSLVSNIFSTNINISLYDNSEFFVRFDKAEYNYPVTHADFNNVPGGSYYLKVVKKQNPTSTDNVVYEGYVNIPDNYFVYSVIDENGNFLIYKKLSSPIPNYDGSNTGEVKHHEEVSGREMNEADFHNLKKLITDRTFESTKMEFAKDGIDRNYFTVGQVGEILQLFDFESNKLELAKYAFAKTCDKNNYPALYNLFVFESNVTDLSDYIKGKY